MPMVYHNARGATHPRLKSCLGAAPSPTSSPAASNAAANLRAAGIRENSVLSLVNNMVNFVCSEKKATGNYPNAARITSMGASMLQAADFSDLTLFQMAAAGTELVTLGMALYNEDVCSWGVTPTTGGGTTTDKDGGDNTTLLVVGAAVLMVGGALLLRK